MKIYIIPFFFLITTACSTKFLVPANRFMIPESSGDFLKGELKAGIAGTAQVQIADDVTSATPDTKPVLSRNSSLYLGAGLGIVDKLDLYYNAPGEAPSSLGIKIQLLGDSQKDSKNGNFSLALAGGASFAKITQSTEVSSIKGESEIKIDGWEAMLLLGYRPADNALIYLAPFKSSLRETCTIRRTSNGSTTVTANPDGEGEFNGVNLGFRLGKNFFGQVEASYINSDWQRTNPSISKADSLSSVVYGAVFGGSW